MRRLTITIETPQAALETLPYPATDDMRRMFEVINRTPQGREILHTLEPLATGAFHPCDIELILAALCHGQLLGGQLDTLQNSMSRMLEARVALLFDDRIVAESNPIGIPDCTSPNTTRRMKLRR